MDTRVIKDLIYAEEFFPFEIVHKKGKTYRITDREFAWISPFGVYVVTFRDGHRVQEILNPKLIEKVHPIQ